MNLRADTLTPTATLMCHDDKHFEQSKSPCRNHKEIDGDDGIDMVNEGSGV
jgi:hypothetical protein